MATSGPQDENLRFGAGTTKQILSGVSGSTHALQGGHEQASMLAILGPSGAGKSTLLDVLAGRPGNRRVEAFIAVQGKRVKPGELQQFCGYVLQDDVFPGASYCLLELMSTSVPNMPTMLTFAMVVQLSMQWCVFAYLSVLDRFSRDTDVSG
jgi:ABC-type cobalamin/Fe3+-siderophores transport system ATPase subunit